VVPQAARPDKPYVDVESRFKDGRVGFVGPIYATVERRHDEGLVSAKAE